ncbi:hypothetical protein QBK99_10975 [Corticibacterium sp. UT-5YL-CI-8]|nr:hypothetical protein [Tianweitania sp. UT-5YL-CI-8]
MSVPWYPAELPKPLRQGYQFAMGDGRSAQRRDAGPARYARRFSSVAHAVAYSTILDASQLARFERFYNEETKQGIVPFFIPDPGKDGWPALTADGTPITLPDDTPVLLSRTWLCTFGERLPSWTSIGMSWTVSFDLVVLP